MEDFCRTLDAVILTHEVDLIIQQIDILMDTTPGEVLGSLNYGANLEEFLYNLNVGSSAVASYITNIIESNVELFGWSLEVDVRFLVGEINDIMMIGIKFSKDGESYSHVYRVDSIQDLDS